MVEFKKIPVINHWDKDDDDNNPNEHYTLTMKVAAIGNVIKNPEFDDGTDDCEGTEENEFTIEHLNKNTIFQDDRLVDWASIKTIHFDDSCTIPRFKLGNFCKNNNINIIRSKEKADMIIYGKDFTQKMFNHREVSLISKQLYLSKVSRSPKLSAMLEYITPIVQASTSEYIIVINCDESSLLPKKGLIEGRILEVKDDASYKEISGNTKFCHQDTILRNMGSEVLTEETFNRLCDMLNSEDTENHRVAMEIMTNCNYWDSIVYLLEIFRRYNGKVFSEMPDRKHVSFFSLREFLEYEPNGDNRNFDEIIMKIVEKNLLTEDNYKLILKFILEEENSKKGMTNNSENWKITQIDLSDDIKAKVIWNKPVEEPVIVLPIADVEVKTEEKQPDLSL